MNELTFRAFSSPSEQFIAQELTLQASDSSLFTGVQHIASTFQCFTRYAEADQH